MTEFPRAPRDEAEREAVDPRRAVICLEVGPNRWCVRSRGHDGDHVAADTHGAIVARWPSTPTTAAACNVCGHPEYRHASFGRRWCRGCECIGYEAAAAFDYEGAWVELGAVLYRIIGACAPDWCGMDDNERAAFRAWLDSVRSERRG